jgi:hypothetical protein
VAFDGPHLLAAVDGWEEIADFALDWALSTPRRRRRRDRGETHFTDLTRAAT